MNSSKLLVGWMFHAQIAETRLCAALGSQRDGRTRSVTIRVTRLWLCRDTFFDLLHMRVAPNRYSVAFRYSLSILLNLQRPTENSSRRALSVMSYAQRMFSCPPHDDSEIVDDSEPEREERRQRLKAKRKVEKGGMYSQELSLQKLPLANRRTADCSIVELSGYLCITSVRKLDKLTTHL